MSATMLSKSPMFQLSLSARELFHSNFLGWLLESYPTLLAPLFAPSLDSEVVLEPARTTKGDPWVRREYLNVDLCIELTAGWLNIENKVKSVPRADQLREYEAKWEAKFRRAKARKPVHWLLLALTDSDLDVLRTMRAEGTCIWRGITYRQLAERLQAAAKSYVADPYHLALIEDWRASVEAVASIADGAGREWPRDGAAQRGLQDLIWKRAASAAAGALVSRLRAHLPETVVTTDLPLEKLQPGSINVYSNLTRGTGLFGFSFVFNPIVMQGKTRIVCLGVQVQAHRIKCYVEFQVGARPADASELRQIAMHLFDVGSADLRIPHWGGTSTKGVGTYSGNHYYRSSAVDRGATTSQLVQQLAESAVAIAHISS